MKLTNNDTLLKLNEVIDESLALLKQASIKEQMPAPLDIPIPSLLDQCLELCQQHSSQSQETIRLVIHFGLSPNSPLFTGLAAQPNCNVSQDIYPQKQTYQDNIRVQTIVAKSILSSYRQEESKESEQQRIQVFLDDLEHVRNQCSQIGQRLIICDNPCLSQKPYSSPPDLFEILSRQFKISPILIADKPADCYKNYRLQISNQDDALNFEDFCHIYLGFIEKHSDMTLLHYKDYLSSEQQTMRHICEILDLEYNEDFLLLADIFESPSENNKNPNDASQDIIILDSPLHQKLCSKLGYSATTPPSPD